MNNWRYYETWGTFRWRINNEKTNQFFLSEYESDAKWLTDTLNMNDERNEIFSKGLVVTDDGDLFKIK